MPKPTGKILPHGDVVASFESVIDSLANLTTLLGTRGPEAVFSDREIRILQTVFETGLEVVERRLIELTWDE